MSEFADNLFQRFFIRLLSKHAGAIDPATKRIITKLLTASVSQHSCIDVSGSDSETINNLSSQPFVGLPGEACPLIIYDNKLYLARFFKLEKEVAMMITDKNMRIPINDIDALHQRLDEKFGVAADNRQKLAAFMSVTGGLTIITGGPGTGKTSTVVKILQILAESEPGINIKLAAPTGKAAMRLTEAIVTHLEKRTSHSQDAPTANEISSEINSEVVTIHRLLGMGQNGRYWRHGPNNPITADVLVIDEASMIDLPLMHRLLGALPETTRLILLGDPDQLPSVDTGNVLADLCTQPPVFSSAFNRIVEDKITIPAMIAAPAHEFTYLLADAVCRLEKSYRFDATSAVGKLAADIRDNSPLFETSPDGCVQCLPNETLTPENVGDRLLEDWPAYVAHLVSKQSSAAKLLNAFEQCRVLCSRRSGLLGVESINQAIERSLEKIGLKDKLSEYYNGRPVLITRNDYNLGLFNGDIGICISIDEGDTHNNSTDNEDHYQVVFPGLHGDSRSFLVSRLPKHESCFAMTVHKAQGSEFDHVTVLFNRESSIDVDNLMTKELVYTAVTRSRKTITVFSGTEQWHSALNHSSVRVSGMTGFLKTAK